MWMILQEPKPDDFVIATGETHSVREYIEKSFLYAGISIEWQGTGLNEKGINSATGAEIINIDPYYFRPTEVDLLLGDYSKANQQFGWKPKTSFEELIKIMMEFELNDLKYSTKYADNRH